MSAKPHVPPWRVLLVSPNADVGGSEVYLEQLATRLPEGVVAGVVVLARGSAAERFSAIGLPVDLIAPWPRLGLPVAVVRLRRLLAARRPDVVHANGIKAALVAVLAAGADGPPVLFVKHDFSWDGPLVRWIARRSRMVIGVSRAVLRSLEPEEVDLRVVHNGVDQRTVDRGEARELLASVAGLTPEDRVVLGVGRLDPGKGQLRLVEALPGVLAAVPRAKLVLVGPRSRFEPEYADRVLSRAAAVGVRDQVVLTGPRSDATTLMAGADVVAVTSRPYTRRGTGEGFGLVAAEAMAAGTPVVAHAHGGLVEVVGPAGRLVDPDDIEALTRALVEVLTDPELAGRLSRAGRERAEPFDVALVAEQMAALYGEAARSR